MITPKIKALFQFIEYLNSNIKNFNQYNDLINELIVIKNEQRKLNPKGNYKDKRQYEKFQKEIESKFKELQHQTADQIKTKATKLKVCSFEGGHIYNFNGIENDIQKLKDNFSKADLREIFKHKRLYLEYRNSTHKTFLSLHIFFEDLDKLTKSLFDFFKDTEQNGFEQFETKAIQVNSIKEIIEGFKQGHTKFTLPTDVLFNPSHSEQSQNEALPPQQTETKTEQETPKTFEELFYNPQHAEPCLKILSELQPPVIDATNNYIGKTKGVFPLWVKVLKNHKPEPLIKHFKDVVYKDLLNQKVKGLNLSKDASEFRKHYKRVENDKIGLDIKTILSQYSQSGKLGK